MKQYLELMKFVKNNGIHKKDRTGTGTLSTFGYQMRFYLDQGFPLLTTKRVHLKSIIIELLWFLRGESNVRFLNENNVKIWDEWANASGDLGPIYGVQWRSWPNPNGESIDQIEQLIKNLNTNPDSRRHIVSAWNVSELENMALPPCHAFFQFYLAENKLSCQLYQRSADIFLGVPFNIASYALLTLMVAQICGFELGDFIHTLGDAHLYLSHLEQVDLQLERSPYDLPQMKLNLSVNSIFDFKLSDFELLNYTSHPKISAPIAV